MLDLAVLAVFIPTFFFVSITPGMCMTLAMTLGMSVGVRRTLWMMVGEVLGVATVAIAAVIGVASIMLNYPELFAFLKYLGGAYLIYLGVNMWSAKTSFKPNDDKQQQIGRGQLFSQGYITAIANGQDALKKTIWFMLSYTGSLQTSPEQSEGITEAVWMKRNDLLSIRNNTYGSINDVLDAFVANS